MIDRSLNYGRHLIRQFLTDALPFETVLDVGAGKGGDLLIAREINPNAILNAIECHAPNFERLKRNNINVYHVDIEKDRLPFPDNSIDVIIMNQIVEHTKEIFWIFHEISRVVRKNGKIIIGVPNLASLHNRLLLLLGMQPTSIKMSSAHVRGYTKADFLSFLDLGFPDGYKLCNFGGSNFYPFPPALANPLAKIFPSMAWGIFFELEKRKKYGKSFLEYPVKLETNFYLGEV